MIATATMWFAGAKAAEAEGRVARGAKSLPELLGAEDAADREVKITFDRGPLWAAFVVDLVAWVSFALAFSGVV